MAVTKIDQIEAAAINPTAINKEKLRKLKGKICMYYEEVLCGLPEYIFQICATCPRNKDASNHEGNLKKLFSHVKSMAILFLKDSRQSK